MDDVSNYDWIEFYWLDTINEYGPHYGKIRSGHNGIISLTGANGNYVGRMTLTMTGQTITVYSNNRTRTLDGVVEDYASILLIEINGIRN